MHAQPVRVGVLFLRRKRPGFDPGWGAAVEAMARAQLAQTGAALRVPQLPIVDEASLREAMEDCRAAGVEVLVVLQPTISDGRLAPVLGQLWDGPIVLWATPEKPDSERVSSCSLVGTHVFAANLRQLGRRFELVYGRPGEEATARDLDRALRLACTAGRLRRARVGLVGYHAPGFIDLQADPCLLSRQLGVELHHFGFLEFLTAMQALPEADVAADTRACRDLGLPSGEVTADDLAVSSRFYLTVRQFLTTEHLAALALREWPEFSDGVGHWPYLAMARLAADGFACGCEGDVDGALVCEIAAMLGCGVSFLSDWLEHDAETIALWHGGNAPFQLCEPIGSPRGPRLALHFNNRKPAVVDADVRAGLPITLFRLWHCDGEYRLMARDAETLRPRRVLSGTNGLAHVPGGDVRTWFEDLCHAGMPHHLAVTAGHRTDLFRRFSRLAGLRWVS